MPRAGGTWSAGVFRDGICAGDGGLASLFAHGFELSVRGSKRQCGQPHGRAEEVGGRLPLSVHQARVGTAVNEQLDERALPPRHGPVEQRSLGRGTLADP